MSEKIVYPFLKSDGFVRPCKKGCPNCKHCTDVWWDYSHGIYNSECGLSMSGPCCDRYENDGTEPITMEEFDRIKEKEDEQLEEFSAELVEKTAATMFHELMNMIFDGINWEDDDGNEDIKP